MQVGMSEASIAFLALGLWLAKRTFFREGNRADLVLDPVVVELEPPRKAGER